ncbi:hypothetical protein HY251_21420 [bacterium]|nr:hypothetical protein [bacterium]
MVPVARPRLALAAALSVLAFGLAARGSPGKGEAPPAIPPLKLSVGFEEDVDRALLDEWGERVEKASALLYEITEGQLWISECTIEDKTILGRVTIPTGKTKAAVVGASAMAETRRPGTPVWRIHSIGSPDGQKGMVWTSGTVLAHELGHALFGFPDERDTSETKGIDCKNCIMGSDPTKLCGPGDHEGSLKPSCRETIQKLHPAAKFPNPKFQRGSSPPKTKIKITDRGEKDPSPELVPLSEKEAKLLKDLEARGRALSIKAGFQGKPTVAQRKRLMSGVVDLDSLLRGLTNDQVFIARCSVEDRAQECLFLVEAGAEETSVLASNKDAMWTQAPGGGSWITAGDIDHVSLGRYLLRDVLKVTESEPACEACVFNTKVWGPGKTKLALCDVRSHKEGRSCLDQLLEKWRDAGVVPLEQAKPVPLPAALPRFKVVERP